ncbi:hypothetical protein GWK91_05670 [Virgibacillus sp. MSP4-1]|uniref:hypothetical protein n=1 Tax=Virgibacillus sp. MSP4-1 TaxID=2700081 RepID=UPI00039BB857|nr:hypothetical protein [Virgibacillus sp. MSP4-1]QHS22470.1 hypothetical protein GWK91_05670 [Virgibacillus sp. MSP4-1]
MKSTENKLKVQPLRTVSKPLYEELISELGKFHIHSFDVQAKAIEKDDGMEIILHFGESFSQQLSKNFTSKQIENTGHEIKEFIRESAEKMKEIMIADYFKMIKP